MSRTVIIVIWQTFNVNFSGDDGNTVCPQSPLGVLRNCGTQTN
jgi:hypothetical protein